MELTLKPREVAGLLDVTEAWLCRLRQAGKGPRFHTVGANGIRYYLSDIVVLAIQRATKPLADRIAELEKTT